MVTNFPIADQRTAAMEMIEDKLLGAPAASFAFTGIPQQYRHLKLIVTARDDVDAAAARAYLGIRFNADAGANYDSHQAEMGAAAYVPGIVDGGTFGYLGSIGKDLTVAGFAPNEVLIPDYAVAGEHYVLYSAGVQLDATLTLTFVQFGYVRWTTGGAITALTLILSSGENFKTGSRATLYGLR
jgi:hypothetical protein